MTVTLISMMRNATSSPTPYLERYCEQVDALGELIDLQVVVAEGDSTDDTFAYLMDAPEIDDVFKIDHGGPMFGSVDDPQRWKQVAYVYNTTLDRLNLDGPLILVEADLIWQPKTMLGLLEDLKDPRVDVVAPLSVQDGHNYETWGHRWPDGTCFPPELDRIVKGEGLQPISSAGSCLAMSAPVALLARLGEDDGIVGFCRDLHEKGFTLYLDDRLRVEHP